MLSRLRNLLAVALSFGATSLTSAAPLYHARPPAPAAIPASWSGFYIGGNIGYSWGRGEASFFQPSSPVDGMPFALAGSQRLNGVIGGPEIGYNWQVTSSWLVGLEADFQWSGEKGSSNFDFPFFASGVSASLDGSFSSDIHWFGTVRGRIGTLVTPTLLLYATGGLAYGRIETSGAVSNSFATFFSTCACGFFSFDQSTNKTGWTIGAGLQGAVPGMSNWLWKAEYLYIDFGTVNGNSVQVGFLGAPFPYSWSTKVTDNILRVGMDYRFH
jgi:outer membrane immunogenic protein